MIRVKGQNFVDNDGRVVILRGVNLGGSSKVPYEPNGATHLNESFYDHRNVSFVGRPFPLEEADEHFKRLQLWGFNTIRLLVTWEAIEHKGSGIYDLEYLDYIYKIISKANEYNIYVLIDFHQDVWSRFSGGDGAPGWIFEELGMDLTKFTDTGSAVIHNINGDPFPHLIWPTNYQKMISATMFTLFFAGNVFATNTKVHGEPVQDFLQRNYINMVNRLVSKVKDLPNIIGFDIINEPSKGYIGWKDLGRNEGKLLKGEIPTPFQSMLLCTGFTQEVETWQLKTFGFKKTGTKVLNPDQKSIWREGYDCIWKENGVWDIDKNSRPILLKRDYFYKVDGKEIDFSNEFMKPFINRIGREIRNIKPDAIIFIETDADTNPPDWSSSDIDNVAYAPHWYDAKTLVFKKYTSFFSFDQDSVKIVLGQKNINNMFRKQLQKKKDESIKHLNGIPTVIGEFGMPFNINAAKAYKTGKFFHQHKATDSYFSAIEYNLLNCIIWNYTSDNDNTHGDQWNAEDFSIFSINQRRNLFDINSGGRALESIVRPYAKNIPGEPVRMSFDFLKGVFEFEFIQDPSLNSILEIFVPNFQYPKGFKVELSDGEYKIDQEKQILYYYHSKELKQHKIKIIRMPKS